MKQELNEIRRAVEEVAGVDITTRTNAWHISRPRQLFWLLAKSYIPKITWQRLAEVAGGHNHSTALIGAARAANDILYDPSTRARVIHVIDRIGLDHNEAVDHIVHVIKDGIKRDQEKERDRRVEAERERKRKTPDALRRAMYERVGVRYTGA